MLLFCIDNVIGCWFMIVVVGLISKLLLICPQIYFTPTNTDTARLSFALKLTTYPAVQLQWQAIRNDLQTGAGVVLVAVLLLQPMNDKEK